MDKRYNAGYINGIKFALALMDATFPELATKRLRKRSYKRRSTKQTK